jgi:Glycosyl transferase family 2
MNYTPITLFVYNRPWHTQQTIEALQRNDFASDSDLIIYADAAKNEEAAQGVREVREYIHTVDGFCTVTIIERDVNLGLAQSIISGVTEVVNRFGRIIVLEDDLVTSPYFLRYMNDALELYTDDKTVASIHGYLYPINKMLPEPFFIRGADCWGWGTWQRAWAHFEPDGKKLLKELHSRRLTEQFDFGGTYPYTEMLQDQIQGSNDSWAIRWCASAFTNDMLTLYPPASLVRNIGLDNSGTHCVEEDYHETVLAATPVLISRLPIKENRKALRAFKGYFRSLLPKRIDRIKGRYWKLRDKISSVFSSTLVT